MIRGRVLCPVIRPFGLFDDFSTIRLMDNSRCIGSLSHSNDITITEYPFFFQYSRLTICFEEVDLIASVYNLSWNRVFCSRVSLCS